MRGVLTAIFLATASLSITSAPQEAAAAIGVQDLRNEVKAKLEAKIAGLEAEADAIRAQLDNPNLSPRERGRLRGELRRIEARIRTCELTLARVDRLPARALEALKGRLPDIVSPA